MKARFKFAYFVGLLVVIAGSLALYLLSPGRPASGLSVNKNKEGIALKGFDPVAYFTEGKPVSGTPKLTHAWMGATWQFSSEANRDLFAADPQRYAPQYGGFCAYGVSVGRKAPIDPDVWKIVDNKLYLNYDAGVGEKWRMDIPGNIAKADANWVKLAKE